jgi:hypothetical protein
MRVVLWLEIPDSHHHLLADGNLSRICADKLPNGSTLIHINDSGMKGILFGLGTSLSKIAVRHAIKPVVTGHLIEEIGLQRERGEKSGNRKPKAYILRSFAAIRVARRDEKITTTARPTPRSAGRGRTSGRIRYGP